MRLPAASVISIRRCIARIAWQYARTICYTRASLTRQGCKPHLAVIMVIHLMVVTWHLRFCQCHGFRATTCPNHIGNSEAEREFPYKVRQCEFIRARIAECIANDREKFRVIGNVYRLPVTKQPAIRGRYRISWPHNNRANWHTWLPLICNQHTLLECLNGIRYRLSEWLPRPVVQ